MKLILSACAAYLMIINVYTYRRFRDDKRKAIKGKWRVSEKELLLLSAFGGSVGALAAMKKFHHKTKKKIFSAGIPAMLIMQILAAALFCFAKLRKH